MGNVLSYIAGWLLDDFRRGGKEGNMGSNPTMDNMIVRMKNAGGHQYKQKDNQPNLSDGLARGIEPLLPWSSGQSGQNQMEPMNDATPEQTVSREHIEQPTGLDRAFAKDKDTITQDSETDSTSLCSTDSEATVAIENISKVRHFFDTILPRAEKSLRQQLNPVILPTQKDFEETLQRLDYKEGFCHFAVAGAAGSGKSSLINSFRGLYEDDPDAAPASTKETTQNITRYDDPDSRLPFVWYDIPGAGTRNVPAEQYFIKQGLYIFDCIVIVIGDRVTEIDIDLIRNCSRFVIPSYIVRSKTMQHIRNITEGRRKCSKEEARKKHEQETRESVANNLRDEGLDKQRVYLVDRESLRSIVQKHKPEEAFDEYDLYVELLAEARVRRLRSKQDTQEMIQTLASLISAHFRVPVSLDKLKAVFLGPDPQGSPPSPHSQSPMMAIGGHPAILSENELGPEFDHWDE